MTRALVLSLLVTGVAFLPEAGAQVVDSVVAGRAALWVEAARASAVLVDDVPRGVPGMWIELDPGPHRVVAVDDPEAWDALRAEQTVDVAPGDSLRLVLDLPRRLRVETLPIRASVVLEDASGARESLGTAPLTVELPADADGVLVASLDGYQTARLPLEAASGPVTILLQPAPGSEPEIELLPTERSTRRRTLVDVGIGAAAVAAGAVAVHYKFRADAIDDDYRGDDPALRGDESLRAEARRLDRYSAVALGVMQAGVGVLALRFVLR